MVLFPACQADGSPWTLDTILAWCSIPGNLSRDKTMGGSTIWCSEGKTRNGYVQVSFDPFDQSPILGISCENRDITLTHSEMSPAQYARLVELAHLDVKAETQAQINRVFGVA